MSGLPPHILASVDQHRALLAELVGGVREHVDSQACEYADACPGNEVARALADLGGSARTRLLYLALAELRALDYGLPVHLTEAAVAALDDKPKSRRWWPWGRQ
ncbi:hypothetical protein ACWD6N_03650 [Micromonospora sp. NPDC005163]